jgi:hypothetical protein
MYTIVELALISCTVVRHFPGWFPGAYYAGFAQRNRSAIEDLHELEYPFREVKRIMVGNFYFSSGRNTKGVPHRSIEDDIYNRPMFIPKASRMIANTRYAV